MAKGNEKSSGGGGGSSNSSGAKSGAANVQLANIPRLNYNTSSSQSGSKSSGTQKSGSSSRGPQSKSSSSRTSKSSSKGSDKQKQGQQYGTDPALEGGGEQQEQNANPLAETVEQGIQQNQQPERSFLAEAMEGTVGKPGSEKPKEAKPGNQNAQNKQAQEDADMDAKWASLEAGQKEAAKPASEQERAEMLRQYQNALNAEQEAAGWATDEQTAQSLGMDTLRQEREKWEEQIKADNRKRGGDLYADLDASARSRERIEGFQGERAGQYGAGLGIIADWLGEKTGWDGLEQWGEGARESGRTTYQQSQDDWGSSLDGRSGLAQTAAGVAKSAGNVAEDMAVNFLTAGIGGRALMALRAAGSGALTQEGREKNDTDSVFAKSMLDMGAALLSNKLLGGLEGAYGKSTLGPKFSDLFKGITNPNVRRAVANTEGFEEGLEFGIDYIGDRLLGLDGASRNPLDKEFWQDWSWGEFSQNVILGYFLGTIFNGIQGGQEYPADRIRAVADEAIEAAQSGLTFDEIESIARDTTKDQVVIKPGKHETDADIEPTVATEPAAGTDVNTPAQSGMENILSNPQGEDGRLSNSQVRQILENPDMYQEFLRAAGMQPGDIDHSSKSAERNAIKDAADRIAQQRSDKEVTDIVNEWNEEQGQETPGPTEPNADTRARVRDILNRADAEQRGLAPSEINAILQDPMALKAYADENGVTARQARAGLEYLLNGPSRAEMATAESEAQSGVNDAERTPTNRFWNAVNEGPDALLHLIAEDPANMEEYMRIFEESAGETMSNDPEVLQDQVNRITDEAAERSGRNQSESNEYFDEDEYAGEEQGEPRTNQNQSRNEWNSNRNEGDYDQRQENNRNTGRRRRPSGNPDENTDELFEGLNERTGTIEKGENPARDINVPRGDIAGQRVGRGARTVMEAAATPDSRLGDLKAAVVNGDFGHIPVTNDTRSRNAISRLANDGWSKSAASFIAAVESGKVSADDIALGAHLLNQAGNSPDCTGRDYVELAMAYNDAVSGTGQALAAARILKTLTPEGKLYGIEKTIEKMNKKIRDGNEKKGPNRQKPEIKLDEGLVEDYLNAETDEERDLIHDEIIRDAAAQVPNTLRDKFTALRYLNMLGNFKTQVRNVAGNIGMGLVQKTKNEVVSAIEGAASAVTGGKYERKYKGLYAPSLHRAAVEDFNSNKSLQDAAMGEAKFSDVGKQAQSDIEKAKDPFSNRNPLGWVLNKYSKATTGAMEIGDRIFVRSTYADALAGYLNAHKITADDWKAMVNDPAKAAEVDKARSYAVKQAQEATFRDTNKLSKFVSTFDQNWGRIPKAIAQGIIPFRKTPANVLVRMEEYSPLGIVNTGVKAAQAAKGNADASEVIDSFAKTLTGTAITALGYMLAAQGRVRTREDDKEQDRLDKLEGKQDYSVEFDLPEQLGGGRRSFTLDWLTPAAGAFFMGSELHDIVETGGITPSEALTTLESFTNPMLEMSMLSGVNDALNNISDFNGDQSAMLQFALNSAWSYLTQGLTNTMLGQAEQFSEDYRQTYYTDKENTSLTPSAQKKLAKLGNKTPGFDYQSADYIDAWGRRQESDPNKAVRAGNVFFNPGYVSKMDEKATAVDGILQDLYKFGKEQTEQDDFPRVIPQTPSRYTTVNGTQLTPKEYEVYATAAGRNKLDLVTKLSKSEQFKNMDKYAQAETISELYKYADFLAASRIAQNRGEEYYDKQYSGIKDLDNPVGYIATKNSFGVATRGEKYDFDAIDALMPNIVKMSDKDRDYLRSKNSQAMSYYDYMTPNAHGYNVDSSEDVFNLKAMEKENATERGVKQASGIDTMKAIEDGYKQNKFSDDDVNALMTKQASDGDYDLSKGRVAIYLAAIASGKTVDEAFRIVNSADRDSNGKIDEKGLYITPEREGTKALKRAGINKAGQRAFDEIMYPNGRTKKNRW